MTRRLPAAVVHIGDALAVSAGYLHNTVREPLVTCATCSTPVEGYDLCYQCHTHVRSGMPIADRVASMVYAVKSSRPAGNDQAYTAMYGYKGTWPRAAQLDLVRSLVGLAVVGHMTCDLKLSRQPLLRWATVPGTRHRTTAHPLHDLVAERFPLPEYEIPIRSRTGATKNRTLQPEDFRVAGLPRGWAPTSPSSTTRGSPAEVHSPWRSRCTRPAPRRCRS